MYALGEAGFGSATIQQPRQRLFGPVMLVQHKKAVRLFHPLIFAPRVDVGELTWFFFFGALTTTHIGAVTEFGTNYASQ